MGLHIRSVSLLVIALGGLIAVLYAATSDVDPRAERQIVATSEMIDGCYPGSSTEPGADSDAQSDSDLPVPVSSACLRDARRPVPAVADPGGEIERSNTLPPARAPPLTF